MSSLTTSSELAKLLLAKARDSADGKNLTGADTLCRVTETVIKLARLEMDLSRTAVAAGGGLLAAPARWVPLNVAELDVLDTSILQAAVKAGEAHLSSIEDAIESVSTAKPKSPAIKALSAEATYVRCYLLVLRDAIND